MNQRFVNNFDTTVAATFGVADTFLQLASVAGLPTLGAGEFLALTIYRQTGVEESGWEVVHMIANPIGNQIEVVREMEGAAASIFNVGDKVSARITAASAENKADASDTAAALAGKEPTIPTGSSAQYIKGDKTLGTHDKASVGLANVDNTSDAAKPVSTATQTALDAKEPTITAGTTGEYWRGDKTWQTLNKTAVGLNNVDNTADADKPVSTAQAAADTSTLNAAKAYTDEKVVGLYDDRGNYDASGNVYPSTGGSGAAGAINKGDIWRISVAGTLGGTAVLVDQQVRALVDTPGQTASNWGITGANFTLSQSITSGATGVAPSSDAVFTGLAGKQATITAGTTGDYYRGDKTMQPLNKAAVGLSNVDNTSDANKPVSTAQQTALDLKANLAAPVFTGVVRSSAAFREAKVAVAAASIDLSLGNYFSKTHSGATTYSVANVATTGIVSSFILDLTNGGSATVTWWSGMKWAGGAAPTLTAAGRDVLGFFTHDGGTTWTGLMLGKDVK